ncbi:MAG: hypothetical protein K0U59_03545 [Gammaproteobacteria bacterium]|nr:hypothetical protein [Gammaproteobacteria bacterium]
MKLNKSFIEFDQLKLKIILILIDHRTELFLMRVARHELLVKPKTLCGNTLTLLKPPQRLRPYQPPKQNPLPRRIITDKKCTISLNNSSFGIQVGRRMEMTSFDWGDREEHTETHTHACPTRGHPALLDANAVNVKT